MTAEGKYGSDIVVDLLRAYGIRYVVMNPGASYRGLHDSLVNWGSGGPEMVICTNEKIAVNMAHGYARATGEPVAAIVHDVVGLMQATMGVYTAYLDQVPVLVLGGTGPMAVAQRRPHIEWVHTAFPQGGLVRDFVKWDDQPFDLQGIVDGFARAYQVATTEPAGPVYCCYDVGLQEARVDDDPPQTVYRNGAGTQFPAAEDAVQRIAAELVAASAPVIVAGRVGRSAAAFGALGELADLLGAPVYDLQWRNNLRTDHPLQFIGQHPVTDADAVLALDVVDLYGALTATDSHGSGDRRWLPRPDARLFEVRLDLLEGNGWSQKFEKYQATDVSVTANTALALPQLITAVGREIERSHAGERVAARRTAWAARHDSDRAGYRAAAEKDWDASPISTARLAGELWEAVRHHDWVHSGSSLAGWVPKLWEYDAWHRHTGRSLGTATQLGLGMGAALAHKDTDRLVVHIEPDGDLLFDTGSLWTIAAHGLPMLMVMFNNRAYYNDWEHQQSVAVDRGRDLARAHIGLDLAQPAPDFAAIARGFGWEATGPVEAVEDLAPALNWAVEAVAKRRIPVLVDVVTQHR